MALLVPSKFGRAGPAVQCRLYCIFFKLFRFPLADYLTTIVRSAPLSSHPGLVIHMGITGLSNLLSIMCKCENVIFWWIVFILFHMSAFNYCRSPPSEGIPKFNRCRSFIQSLTMSCPGRYLQAWVIFGQIWNKSVFIIISDESPPSEGTRLK